MDCLDGGAQVGSEDHDAPLLCSTHVSGENDLQKRDREGRERAGEKEKEMEIEEREKDPT